MSLFPFFEIVNAILSPSGCQLGEEAMPSNLGTVVDLIYRKG